MNKSIIVTNNFRGYHKYDDAPAEVGFLKSMHRHNFNVKTKIEVVHNDRDIEFYQLQYRIETFVNARYRNRYGDYIDGIYIGSCESLAEDILKHLHALYPNRRVCIEVWEDNENGAIVED